MASRLRLGARAAGLLLVAWVVVASSTASVAKRIAGRYRKQPVQDESAAVYNQKRKLQSAPGLASIDLLAKQKALLSQGPYAPQRRRWSRTSREGSRSACCAVCEFELPGAEYKKVTCKVHLQTRV